MNSRRLLVTFDAFGTLFEPKSAIEQQYSRIAGKFGVRASPGALMPHFAQAFKQQSSLYPNYGRSKGMSPEEWWSEVIKKTFAPNFVQKVPPELPSTLIKHFASSSAYRLNESIPPLLQSIRKNKQYDTTILGVVSNSDPRVPSILQSLGIHVKDCRNQAPGHNSEKLGNSSGKNGTLDFVTLSYDVGFEKPDPRIWEAAATRAGAHGKGWKKIHVGDDFEKDIEGARGAGWDGMFPFDDWKIMQDLILHDEANLNLS